MTPHAAREALLGAALEVLRDERALAGERPSVGRLKRDEDALAIAARDLASAIDDLPLPQQPKGWDVP